MLMNFKIIKLHVNNIVHFIIYSWIFLIVKLNYELNNNYSQIEILNVNLIREISCKMITKLIAQIP